MKMMIWTRLMQVIMLGLVVRSGQKEEEDLAPVPHEDGGDDAKGLDFSRLDT